MCNGKLTASLNSCANGVQQVVYLHPVNYFNLKAVESAYFIKTNVFIALKLPAFN